MGPSTGSTLNWSIVVAALAFYRSFGNLKVISTVCLHVITINHGFYLHNNIFTKVTDVQWLNVYHLKMMRPALTKI